MYSFSYLEPVCCYLSHSNCCLLTWNLLRSLHLDLRIFLSRNLVGQEKVGWYILSVERQNCQKRILENILQKRKQHTAFTWSKKYRENWIQLDLPWGGHGNPLQYSCLEKPMDREPGWLPPIELQTVRHNWGNWAGT